MKKEYNAPILEIVDVTVEYSVLDTSSSGTPGTLPDLGGGGENLTNEKRGQWGDVWK